MNKSIIILLGMLLAGCSAQTAPNIASETPPVVVHTVPPPLDQEYQKRVEDKSSQKSLKEKHEEILSDAVETVTGQSIVKKQFRPFKNGLKIYAKMTNGKICTAHLDSDLNKDSEAHLLASVSCE